VKPVKLWQQCLLDVSGELTHTAREKLRDRVEKYPDAKIEYEVIRGRYKLLRSLPPPDESIDPIDLQRMQRSVKGAVQKELDKNQRKLGFNRFKHAGFRFMLVASGMAAGLLLVAGLSLLQIQSQSRQESLLDAENTFNELAESKLPMQSGDALSDLADKIASLQKSPSVESRIGNAQFMNLLDALDQASDDAQQGDGGD